MEGSRAETGKPSVVAAAAIIVVCGLTGLAPTAAMAQLPFPMMPFPMGPQQHYRSGSGTQHYTTRSHSRHDEDTDKTKEKDAHPAGRARQCARAAPNVQRAAVA